MNCEKPVAIKKNLDPSLYPDGLLVPCGKCLMCRVAYRKEWTLRMIHESGYWEKSSFITLTYDNDHLPENNSLVKHDLKCYFKRLRKSIEPDKIKYFAVGEYGFQKDRPHYHIILLNSHEKFIVDSWKYGGVHIGQVAQASIMYCLKYVMKEGKIPKHQNDDRVPEYRRSSIKLGLNYLSPAVIDYHKKNEQKPYITLEGGFKVAIPRYFRKKIWTDLELKKINDKIAQQVEKIELQNEKSFTRKYPNQNYHDTKQRNAEYKHQVAISRNKKTRD